MAIDAVEEATDSNSEKVENKFDENGEQPVKSSEEKSNDDSVVSLKGKTDPEVADACEEIPKEILEGGGDKDQLMKQNETPLPDIVEDSWESPAPMTRLFNLQPKIYQAPSKPILAEDSPALNAASGGLSLNSTPSSHTKWNPSQGPDKVPFQTFLEFIASKKETPKKQEELYQCTQRNLATMADLLRNKVVLDVEVHKCVVQRVLEEVVKVSSQNSDLFKSEDIVSVLKALLQYDVKGGLAECGVILQIADMLDLLARPKSKRCISDREAPKNKYFAIEAGFDPDEESMETEIEGEDLLQMAPQIEKMTTKYAYLWISLLTLADPSTYWFLLKPYEHARHDVYKQYFNALTFAVDFKEESKVVDCIIEFTLPARRSGFAGHATSKKIKTLLAQPAYDMMISRIERLLETDADEFGSITISQLASTYGDYELNDVVRKHFKNIFQNLTAMGLIVNNVPKGEEQGTREKRFVLLL